MTKTQAWVIVQQELQKLDKPENYDELGVAKYMIMDNNPRLEIVLDKKVVVSVEYESEVSEWLKWEE